MRDTFASSSNTILSFASQQVDFSSKLVLVALETLTSALTLPRLECGPNFDVAK